MNHRQAVSYYSVYKFRTLLDGCFYMYRNIIDKYLSNKITSMFSQIFSEVCNVRIADTMRRNL